MLYKLSTATTLASLICSVAASHAQGTGCKLRCPWGREVICDTSCTTETSQANARRMDSSIKRACFNDADTAPGVSKEQAFQWKCLWNKLELNEDMGCGSGWSFWHGGFYETTHVACRLHDVCYNVIDRWDQKTQTVIRNNGLRDYAAQKQCDDIELEALAKFDTDSGLIAWSHQKSNTNEAKDGGYFHDAQKNTDTKYHPDCTAIWNNWNAGRDRGKYEEMIDSRVINTDKYDGRAYGFWG